MTAARLWNLPLAAAPHAIGRDGAPPAPGSGGVLGLAAAWPDFGSGLAALEVAMPGFAEPADGKPTRPERPARRSTDSPAARQMRAEAVRALVGSPLAAIEREVCEATITHCGGSVPQASVMLGISPSTLYRKLAAWSRPGREA